MTRGASMDDVLTRRKWQRRALITATVLLCVAVVGYVGIVARTWVSERDVISTSRLYSARNDIEHLSDAVQRYKQMTGRYPHDLSEVQDKLEPWGRVRIPLSPWGGPYGYSEQGGEANAGFRIWAVPDDETQRRIGARELSNETDWASVGVK